MSMWNPWRGCKKCSDGCLHCYIHKGDSKRGIVTDNIVKTKDFEKPIERRKNGNYKMKAGIVYTCFSTEIPLTITDYRDKKILKHFFTTPCSPLWILGSDILCAGVTALLSAISVALVSVVFLGYEMKGNAPAFMGSWMLTLVSMFSIGLLMASLCRTIKSVNAVTTLVYFPMLFLSGATIPYELFPGGLQKFADVLPLTQGIKLMKAVSMGAALENVWKIVVLLLGITVICTVLSVKTFRWE